MMQRGEVWFAKTPGGDRPVLVLTSRSSGGSNRVSGRGRAHEDSSGPDLRIRVDATRGWSPDGVRCQLRQHPYPSQQRISPTGRPTESSTARGVLFGAARRHGLFRRYLSHRGNGTCGDWRCARCWVSLRPFQPVIPTIGTSAESETDSSPDPQASITTRARRPAGAASVGS